MDSGLKTKNPLLGWLGLVAIFIVAIVVAIVTGPGGLSFNSFFAFRLPRVFIGIVAGGVLGVIGGALQALLRNPLVDPWTLGVASGAALGASLAVILKLNSTIFLPILAFLGAVLAIGIVYSLARGKSGLTVTRLVLAGIIVSFFFSSLVLLLMVSGRRSLGEAVYLMMGHLGVVFTSRSLPLFIVSGLLALAGCLWLLLHARELDIISLSEEAALSLGVNVQFLTRMVFLIGSFTVGLVVAWTGAISFIGLVVPHLVRMMFGPRHSRVLPGSFLLGAGLLLFADAGARNIVPGGLPLSVITALIGVPFFIYLLRTRL
ncbi:MAG: iron ABC transporter permease [candidate division WOR-3 bacterium]